MKAPTALDMKASVRVEVRIRAPTAREYESQGQARSEAERVAPGNKLKKVR
jgi:hypothetical protein